MAQLPRFVRERKLRARLAVRLAHDSHVLILAMVHGFLFSCEATCPFISARPDRRSSVDVRGFIDALIHDWLEIRCSHVLDVERPRPATTFNHGNDGSLGIFSSLHATVLDGRSTPGFVYFDDGL